MVKPVVNDAVVEPALARSTLYRFLSVAWCPPDDGSQTVSDAQAVSAAVLAAAHRVGGATLAVPAERATAALAGEAHAALSDQYRHLFGHQISRDCPLHETQYDAGHVFQQAQQLADIAGFYLAFGLEVDDAAGERMDHLSLELEFMHTLAFREAYALIHHGSEEVSLLRDAQRSFLRDHLGRWVPAFTRLVAGKGEGTYRHLAEFTAAIVTADSAAFGLPAGDDIAVVPLPSLDPEERDLPCGADRCPLEPSP